MKKNKSHLILKNALSRIQKSNPKFSIRALALKVGISHVFMLKLLKGEAAIPDKKISAIIRALDLDEIAQMELKETIVYDTLKEKISYFPDIKNAENKKFIAEKFAELPLKNLTLINHWYELPLLDLLTCEPSPQKIDEMAQSLGIKNYEVEHALERMLAIGLVEHQNGSWKKTNLNIRFPANTPSETLKSYYKEVLKKIDQTLGQQSKEQYNKRSITNLSFAVNPEKIQQAKEKLQKAMYEIAEEMAEGPCSEVYFLTTSLIPVSKSTLINKTTQI